MPRKRTMKRRVKKILARVRESKKSKQKTITVPKSAKNIKRGDWVLLRRIA